MSNNLKMLPTVTVGTSAVPVDGRGANYHKYASIQLQADSSNSGVVYVGDNSGNLSTSTYVRSLKPGDFFTISGSAIDATRIFVLGSAAGQIVHVGAS